MINDLKINEQTFEDYKSKYLDIYDKVRKDTVKQKESILEDIDFEIELIHRDTINVAYILKLLARLKEAKGEEYDKQHKQVSDLLSGDPLLRSKKELIEKFIQNNLPKIDNSSQIEEEFETFWNDERKQALEKLCNEEKLSQVKLQSVIDNYLFTERKPIRDEVIEVLKEKPKILERKTILERIIQKIEEFVETFINGV